MTIKPIKITWEFDGDTYEKIAYTAGQFLNILNWIEYEVKIDRALADFEAFSISDASGYIYISTPDGKVKIGTITRTN